MSLLFPYIATLLIVGMATVTISPIRKVVITGPLFNFLKKFAPKISPIERQAIEAGTAGFDAELFSGKPDWDKFRAIKPLTLTEEEQKFLDGPTKEFCHLINDWQIRGEERTVGDTVWNFAKKHGFLGLRVSKEAGGHGFSAQAQSLILGMVASRSLDASTTVEVPNSLGPDELLEQYGTEEQKKQYLKALVSGEEIACFAITSPAGGSDAASMHDVGYVTHGMHKETKALGISLTWFKRYITLAPRATLIVLAFHLFDPEHLLGGDEDRGITLALIPADHKGVSIGRRFLPGGSVFPNGPIWGKDVFIPIEWVLGGQEGVGKGWRMVMQCLAAGRGISLPSMSAAATKMMLLTSSAYARIRRQFNKPIGKIEGIEEPLARIVEAAYITESARAVTSSMISRDERPLVISSIMKYQTTERTRQAINDAMDIHGGKGIIDGPSNYLQSAYQIAPVAITVEGANIITRSLIVIGQAILRSHPYFRREVEAFENTANPREALRQFDSVFSAHVSSFVFNFFTTLFHNSTGGFFGATGTGPTETRRWYRELSHASKRFAFLADVIIMVYKSQLKKQQKIGGRLTDALSELYLLSCALKRFEDDGAHSEEYPILQFCMQNGLYRFDNSIKTLVDNVSSLPVRWLLRIVSVKWGAPRKMSSDNLGSAIVQLVLVPGPVRDRLTRFVYIPQTDDEPIGALEKAMLKSVELEEVQQKVDRAVKEGILHRYHNTEWVSDAAEKGIISSAEAKKLQELALLVEKVSSVDHFDPAHIRGVIHE